MSSRSQPSAFLKNILHNGMNRYVCQLHRVYLNFCKSHATSRGMRDFIEKDLLDFTKDNPGIAIYLKPRRHRSPRIVATYLNGKSHIINVDKMNRDEICQWVNFAKTRSGVEIVRLRKPWHTDHPSIQGVWNPFMFKNTSLNVESFPNSNLGKVPESETATHKLLQLAEQLRQTKLDEGNPGFKAIQDPNKTEKDKP